jgi:hypothetical protein
MAHTLAYRTPHSSLSPMVIRPTTTGNPGISDTVLSNLSGADFRGRASRTTRVWRHFKRPDEPGAIALQQNPGFRTCVAESDTQNQILQNSYRRNQATASGRRPRQNLLLVLNPAGFAAAATVALAIACPEFDRRGGSGQQFGQITAGSLASGRRLRFAGGGLNAEPRRRKQQRRRRISTGAPPRNR